MKPIKGGKEPIKRGKEDYKISIIKGGKETNSKC
jgi:hypothetical protein